MALATAIASNRASIDPVVKITLGNQDMCSSADDTALTTMSMLTPDDDDHIVRDCCEDINKLQATNGNGMSYDKLDFNRPIRQLKPHYTSSTTLQSMKSTIGRTSREGGDGSSDDAQSPKDNDGNSLGEPGKQRVNQNDDGYIDCADLVRRHVDNSNPPSSFIITAPQSSNNNSSVPSSHGIILKVCCIERLRNFIVTVPEV